MNDLQITVFALVSFYWLFTLSFYWLFNIKEKQRVPSLVPFLLQVMKKAQSWKKQNNLTAQALFFLLLSQALLWSHSANRGEGKQEDLWLQAATIRKQETEGKQQR